MGIVAALRAASRKVEQIIREEIDEPRCFSEVELAAAPSGEEPGQDGGDSRPPAALIDLPPWQRGTKPIPRLDAGEGPGSA